jgi:hypothetical protein
VKQFLLLMCLVPIVLIGCSSSLAEKVVGSWKIDTDSISDKDMPAALKADPEYAAKKAAALQKMEEARIEFKADGTFVSTGLPGDKSGKWKLIERELVLTDDAGRAGKSMKATIDADASRIHLRTVDPSSGDPGIDFIKT